MKKGLVAVLLGGLLVLTASVRAATRYTCSLAGKTVEKCCCAQQKDGNLYCTLAKQAVDPCCCKEIAARWPRAPVLPARPSGSTRESRKPCP